MQDYEAKLQWYRDYAAKNANSPYRRIKEYASYLQKWFSDGPCDGVSCFQARINRRILPMSYNVYFN